MTRRSGDRKILTTCATTIILSCTFFAIVLWIVAVSMARRQHYRGDEEAAVFGLMLIVVAWLTLAVWTFIDAWRRSDAPLAWGLLTLITGPIGWAVYRVSRRVGPSMCPLCRNPIEPDFLVCPHCSGKLRPRCRACGRALNAGWLCCPYCSAPMDAATFAGPLDEPEPPPIIPPHAQHPGPRPYYCPYAGQPPQSPCPAANQAAPPPTEEPGA